MENILKKVETEKAPAAIGPYSQAMVVGNFVFTSGQLPVCPETGEVPSEFEAQATQVLENLGHVLAAAGSSFNSVVKTLCFCSLWTISWYSTKCTPDISRIINRRVPVWPSKPFRRMCSARWKRLRSLKPNWRLQIASKQCFCMIIINEHSIFLKSFLYLGSHLE